MRERSLKAKIGRELDRTTQQIFSREVRPAEAWWLSFADDDGFRGAVIVHAEDFMTAIMEVNLRGINPRGECMGHPISGEGAAKIPEKWKYKVLSRKDCAAFDVEMISKLASEDTQTKPEEKR